MKKFTSLLLALAMVLSLSACGGKQEAPPAASGGESGGAQTYTLKCSTYLSNSDILYPLLEQFCADVAEKTGGNVKITLYPSEQLGPYDQTFEETMRGTIEMGFNAVPSTYDKRLECVYVPGAYQDYDMLKKFAGAGSTVYNNFEAGMDALGIKMLGFMFGGYNNLVLNCDLPESYADPSVKKDTLIRVPSGVAIAGSIVEAMGYNTAALNGSEVYSSLQTGVIQGTIGQSNSLVLSAYSDVVQNIVETRLYISLDPIFINKAYFESMPAEYQKVIEDCAADFFLKNVDFLDEQDAEVEEKLLQDHNIHIVHLSDEDFATLNEAIITKVWPIIEENFGADFIDGIKKDIGLN